MRSFLPIIAAALLATGFAAPAAAADPATDKFVRELGSLGARDGVKVDRISVRDGTVLATGVNRQGKRVTLVRACGERDIVCPPALLTQLSREQRIPFTVAVGAPSADAR